ncbi:MAG: VWA domain-containing protein [Pseudomonadota bacterium]
MKHRLARPLATVLAVQLLLSACSATAHSPPPAGTLPDPKPQMWPAPTPQYPQQHPVVRTMPNFQAPSATHCSRPVQTKEVPGRQSQDQQPAGRPEPLRDRLAKAAPAEAASAAPSVRAESSAGVAAGSSRSADSFAPPAPPQSRPWPAPAQPAPQMQRPPSDGPVTAGMVDDNADFTAYLAFRNRTRVQHRPRDIRERYLLEVKDARGTGIADAEVAVQSASGHAMWARTDAAGRAWIHPNAFDPSQAASYEVAVRKEGRQAWGRLARGQKSSVEVVLDARPAQARARLDLVFMIDATGSMADEIDKLKTTLRSISAEVSRLPSDPDLCFGLVAYRDRGDAFLTRTHDLTNDLGGFLQGALIPLQAGGGGDYPEAMNEAFHETVHNISWRGEGATRMVILLADAPPHLDYGGPQYDEAMMAALGKGIKVHSVGASGLDKQGEFIQRQIAQYTGGRFVFLTYDQARDPSSGPGRETVHDVKNYSVDTLDRLIVRLVSDELGKLARR